jgi:hypothetical protein
MSDERHAIEALRAGVPNRAAIRLMGSMAEPITARFQRDLNRCGPELSAGRPVTGQVVAGAFGAGKSHLLGYLQEAALRHEFVVSTVTISKETPLFDSDRLFATAMRNAVVPKQNEDAITAILARLQPDTEAFDQLEQWASSDGAGLSPLFPALLFLLPRVRAVPERVQAIGRFLAGGRPGMTPIRQWLRESGAHRTFPLKSVKPAELARQRRLFLPRLIAAAGYGGWAVLLDEVELVGRYSVMQRARSYAELARWLAIVPASGIPGVVTVAAITDDFAANAIKAKRDDELAAARLTDKGEREAAPLAAAAIKLLLSPTEVKHLRAPDAATLRASLDRTRDLYQRAYGWSPPATDIGQPSATRSMRQYIKGWITTWDLDRLYGVQGEIVSETPPSDYAEDRDLEALTPEPEGEAPPID